MEEKELEKILKLKQTMGNILTDREVLIVDTARKILKTRIQSDNPTEKLSMEICLDALLLLIDTIGYLNTKGEIK